MNSSDGFDPNSYYRITNCALGGQLSLSLDVVNPPSGIPDGSTSMAASGPFSGQMWQVLESNKTGHYYISGRFLGAKKKLDSLRNQRGDYAPFLKSYTTRYAQTWTLIPQVDERGRTAWKLMPDFVTGSNGKNLAITVYNDTRQPFLSPLTPVTRNQARKWRWRQLWFISPTGLNISDPIFSLTHLSALPTEVGYP